MEEEIKKEEIKSPRPKLKILGTFVSIVGGIGFVYFLVFFGGKLIYSIFSREIRWSFEYLMPILFLIFFYFLFRGGRLMSRGEHNVAIAVISTFIAIFIFLFVIFLLLFNISR